MTGLSPLLAEFIPLVNAEMERIGFTEDDFRYLASGGEISRAILEDHLIFLRTIPSGIGADAYFALQGVDFPALKRANPWPGNREEPRDEP